MYKKEDNIFVKNDDGSYLMKVQYKNIWYNVYIDEDDFEKVSKRHWRSSHKKRKVYIVSGSKAKNNTVYLHNYIMNYTYISGYEVDHIDGNSLNNRKCNLRLVTRQENIINTRVRIDNKIGIRGISYSKRDKLYTVDFYYMKKRYYFPRWKTIEEAVYCRKFAEEYFHMNILNNNPLVLQYLTLDKEKQTEIHNIVDKILRK